MKKGESVRRIPSIDGTTTCEKPTSEAKNKSYDNHELLQPFKEIPWRQSGKRRESSSTIAETDDVMIQGNSSALLISSLVVLANLHRGGKYQQPKKKQRGPSTEQPISCASTGMTNTISNCNNGADMPTVLLRSDRCPSEKIHQNCTNVNSSAPPQQIKPTANDVIYGRGIAANQHNQSFHAEIRSRHDTYARGNPATQLQMVTELIEWVRNRKGRFLVRDSTNYIEIDDSVVSSKIRQSLRDCKPKNNNNRNSDTEETTTTVVPHQPTARDVICGRGTAANQHNRLFLEQVDTRHFDCVQGEDLEKTERVNELTKLVQNRQGRFLKKDSNDCYDINVSDVNDTIRQRVPRDHDVIFRRGQPANEGTHCYRELLHHHGLAYVSCNDDRARQQDIVDEIRGRIRNKGGCFLTMHSGSLIELNDAGVNDKIRQGLRDSASKLQGQNHGK